MKYKTTWVHIENELDKMQQALQENQRFLTALSHHHGEEVLSDSIVGALAMNLQSFYTGVERICLRVAKDIDQSVPNNDRWHKTLLEQMAIDTEQRPYILTEKTFLQLEELRGFRHFVRNAYTYVLDAPKVLTLAESLKDCYGNLRRDYSIFRRRISEA